MRMREPKNHPEGYAVHCRIGRPEKDERTGEIFYVLHKDCSLVCGCPCHEEG